MFFFHVFSASLNSLPHCPVRTLKQRAFLSFLGKEENAGNQYLLFSHNVFYLMKDSNHNFSNFNLVKSKLLLLGKELTLSQKASFH